MSDAPNITPEARTIVEMPGFRGVYLGVLNGLAVIDAVLTGSIPAHAADSDEFVYVLSGSGVVHVGDDEHHLHTGDHLFIPKGVMHSVTCDSQCRALLVGA
jgi:mannose-6-phosphate isomerase-like protein (cupin superfamily)